MSSRDHLTVTEHTRAPFCVVTGSGTPSSVSRRRALSHAISDVTRLGCVHVRTVHPQQVPGIGRLHLEGGVLRVPDGSKAGMLDPVPRERVPAERSKAAELPSAGQRPEVTHAAIVTRSVEIPLVRSS